MIFSFFFLSLLILLSLKYKTKSVVFIYAVWFLLIFIDYTFVQNTFVPFSKDFDFFFVSFSLIFIFNYLVFDCLFSFSKIKFAKYKFISYQLYYLFSVYLAFISIFLCIKAFATMPILVVRSKIAANELSFHVGISFPFISSCLFFQNTNAIKKKKGFLIILLFTLAIISSSKQFIVLAFLFSIPWYTRKFKISLFAFIAIGVLGFLMILILHALTGRVAGTGNLIQKTIYTINGYLLGGIAVFQLFLDGVMQSNITTGGWVKTGKWIGNVYSGFYNFYQNRNVFILSIKIISISFLYASLNINRKSIFSNFMRIYSIYPLLFFIFADLFFPAISQWIIFSCAGFGLCLIKKGKGA